MAEEVVIKFKTESGQSVNAVKDLKKEIRELESLSLQAAEAGDEALARRYANAAGEAKDKLSDFKEEIKSTADASSRFGAIANVGAGIAAGFQAAQGALALFGAEGKAVQEALLKVQAASALAQGLQGVAGLADSFNVAKKVAVDAFKAIRAAIGSTGIGLLVVALGTVVAYWDEIKASISGVSAEQKKLNEATNANLKAQNDKLETIDAQDNILKLQGKSERDILKLKIAQTDEVIAAQELAIQNAEITLKAQIEAEKRNKAILQGLLSLSVAPIQLLIDGIDLVAEKLTGTKLIDFNIADFASSFVFDPEQVAEEGAAALEAQRKTLTQLQNNRAGYLLQIGQLDQAASDKKKEQDDKQAADEKKRIDDAKELALKQAADFKSRTEQEYQESLKLTTDYYDALIKQKQLNNEDTTALELEKSQALINVGKDYAQNTLQQELDLALKQKELRDKQAAEEIAKAQLRRQLQSDLVQQVANSLGQLSSLFKKGSAASKVAALTEIAVNTGLGFANGLRIAQQTAASTGPAAAFAFPIFYATQVAAVLAAANRAKSILQSGSGGGGGGGGSVPTPTIPTAPAPTAPTVPTFNPQGTIIPQSGQQQQNTIKAYVLEDDISTSQNRITDIKTKALYG
jgi:hypothetical protein